MDSQLNERLIHAMQEQLPKRSNLALALMSILSLGKGAAYRRLSGEVMFTFEEVAKISQNLGVSLDKIVATSKTLEVIPWAFINMNTLYSPPSYQYMEQYERKLKILSEMLNNIQNQSKAVVRNALSHLPFYFIAHYRNLFLFRHYKRAYLTKGTNPVFRFSDITITPGLLSIKNQLLKKCLEIPKNLLILDKNVFSLFVEDIEYFYRRQLITENERMNLKEELLDLLAFIENITETGTFKTGSEVSIYLSDVALEGSYIHLESDNFEGSLQYMYFVDTLSFNNPIICQMQKNWIESLKRYSTLITQTGDMQRIEFFNKQRKLIELMI